jgi:hypothetical protein
MGREKLGEAERDPVSIQKDRHASQRTKTPKKTKPNFARNAQN